MKLYIDSANLAELEALTDSPFVDGITINPTLVAHGMGKEHVADIEYFDYLQKIRKYSPGELFIQLIYDDRETVQYEIAKIRELIRWPVVIKVPANQDGYYTVSKLTKEGIAVAVTAVYSPGQACLGLAAGAKYIIPYYSRIEKQKQGEGLKVVKEIMNITGPERLLVASIKTEEDFCLLLSNGVKNFTVPYSLYRAMGKNEMTDVAVQHFSESFRVDWKRKK